MLQTDPIYPTGLAEISKSYLRDETELVAEMIGQISLSRAERDLIHKAAVDVVEHVRKADGGRSAIDDLLQEYGLSTDEGVTLMRLSEALVRTPDYSTSRMLIRDKIGNQNWRAHAGKSDSFLVNQATNGLRFTSGWIAATGGAKATSLLSRLGDTAMAKAMNQAMEVMGNHFVLGTDIKQACKRAEKNERRGIAHSYDMLGEAAYTHQDAERYFEAYLGAINHLAENTPQQSPMAQNPGLSVKLSALHPRYEFAKRETCVPILIERVSELARCAASAGLWLNIDAEEADRLELSLEIFAEVLNDPQLKDWPGFGMVVQAYQRRAIPVIEHIHDLAVRARQKIALRLVKGAYWDMEIKRAQELGLRSYPVFTRKENTDISYLACAQSLLSKQDNVFPQFATHNAHTACAIAHMAGADSSFELQRLHGMGAELHAELSARSGARSRIYAPVGNHKDLLPYLVRRLLENGANGSFVNQLMNPEMPAELVAADPMALVSNNTSAEHPKIPTPVSIVEHPRKAAAGYDLTQSLSASRFEESVKTDVVHQASSLIFGEARGTQTVEIRSPQNPEDLVGIVASASAYDVSEAVTMAAISKWGKDTSSQTRAEILETAANLFEAEMQTFLELCVREAGKTLPDAIAEVREAIDFCRYYALQARSPRLTDRSALGVVACISPWNFPMAIFIGQIAAALSVGNTVVAKPAEQTPLIAAKTVDVLYRAGVPSDALQLVLGSGAELGNALVRHHDVAGVCFTGSTRTAKLIAANLASTGRGDVPLIAETGGINAMIVDSTALLEQAVQDVVASAFQSAGQRCSACRLVCVQDDIADTFIEMLSGAMQALDIGDPAILSTDIGPVIDKGAQHTIESHCDQMKNEHRLMAWRRAAGMPEGSHFVGAFLFELDKVSDLKKEVFGPVLHLVRFRASELPDVIQSINDLGFGLTMGLHTRLDERVEDVARLAHVGNLYVNRNQIGAVVGVQPFGGEALSGTGPKAGGPHYLLGLTRANSSQLAAPRRAISVEYDQIETDQRSRLLFERCRRAGWSWANDFSLDERAEHVVALLKLGGGEYDTARQPALPAMKLHLPGPTGEENTLKLCAKSVFICFGGDDVKDLERQVAQVLLSGAAAIVVEPLPWQSGSDPWPWRTLGCPDDLVQLALLDQALALINEPIDGIVADGHIRNFVATHACLRDGPILPVLSQHDPIERFMHERTLTVNTTAAGGNASLLAME